MQSTNTTKALIEPSFAEALAAIEVTEDLTKDKRRHWACSLRVIPKGLGKPLELIPARWTAVRIPISRLHHAQMGVTAKTLANHRANTRAALSWFAEEENVPLRGAPLSEDWARLRDGISHRRTRALLSSPMRFWSARGIGPEKVDETALDACIAYRAATTALKANAAARRRIARAWNGCIGVVPGWPSQRLTEPPPKSSLAGPAFEEFPAGLGQDIETYLTGLTQIRRSPGGRRRAPCKPSTVKVCRAKLVAFVRKAHKIGVAINRIVSFRELLNPDLVERVFDAYWQDSGEHPSIYLIELASLLLGIARETRCVDEAAIARLDDMRAALEEYRPVGLTEKNMTLIRQVLSSDMWRLVVNLPWQLMRQANAIRDRAPVKAAGLAQLAVAIAILSVFPIRLGNLGAIRIGENLIRPGGPGTPYWLVFSGYDVKNRVRLETVFDAELTELIDDYIHNHLHVLLRGSNEPWLFPGMQGGHKGLATLSSQITKCIQKATGLRVTVHQFRHAAAALILRAKPGNYEYVRRILGHRNVQTTINFYIGLETVQATQEFGEIIRSQLRFDPEAA
jgi:Phage integrase family